MLQCCNFDGKTLTVPEFFAVGKTFRALLLRAVKGGDRLPQLLISAIFKVLLSLFLLTHFFIGHLTLSIFARKLSKTLYICFMSNVFYKNLCFEDQKSFLQKYYKKVFPYNAAIQAPSRHMRWSAYGCCIPTLTRFTGPIAHDPDNSVIKKSNVPTELQEARYLVYTMKLQLVKKHIKLTIPV